jgi:hypothetical protein
MAAALVANFVFWTGLSIGGVVFAALIDVMGGTWAESLRPMTERMSRFLPASLVAFVAVMWRSHQPLPIAARDAAALIAVGACALVFCRAAARAREHRAAAVPAAAILLLIVYALGFGVVVLDVLTSREPRWTSTLFPAFVLVGNVYAGVAMIALISACRPVQSPEALTRAQTRDLANILAGLALLWTYLFWSQFLVIWYGNLTSEVGYMMRRIGVSRPGGWTVLAMCGGAPALVFVPQWGKHRVALQAVCAIILAGLWLEQWILVAADVPAGEPPWLAPAITAVFIAAFALVLRRQR